MRKGFVPLFLPFLALLAGCSPPPVGDGKTVFLSYNVQNIFDAELDGSEYEEFREGWTEELYHLRLSRLSEVIRRTSPPPDVVLLQEIEDETVLEDLTRVYLSEYGYSQRILGGPESSATQVGLLTHLPVVEVRRHAPPEAEYPLRNVLEVRLDLGESEMVLFGNHWKSRYGGGEKLRLDTARMVRLRLDRLLRQEPELAILLAGDFNSEPATPDEGSQAPLLINGSSREFLNVTDQLGSADGRLYTPWDLAAEEGSYEYRGRWERIDAFYLSPGLLREPGPEFESFSVHPWDELRAKDRTPLRWITDLESGYSDHLPILLVLSTGG
ncbi:MAG: endonuclease/exonuclease/phosphatase family protein [Spirochaetaceae bacterium]